VEIHLFDTKDSKMVPSSYTSRRRGSVVFDRLREVEIESLRDWVADLMTGDGLVWEEAQMMGRVRSVERRRG